MTPEQQKVYDESTRVAQKAAGMIGGTYTPQTGFVANQTPQKPTPSGVGLSDAEFINSLNGMQQGFSQNNDLLKQRSALLQQLYTAPGSLNSQQMSELPPDLQQLIQSGNTSLMKVQLQSVNDALQNKQNTLAQSLQYLTKGYFDSVTAAEQRKKDAETALKDYATATGDYSAFKNYIEQEYPGLGLGSTADNITGVTSSIDNAMQAISQFESGGNYSAIGQPDAKGQKAYGKYQIMDFNIPTWTQEALGQSMTPEQFLADPQAQDAVAKAKIGEYWNQYGNINDVASMWFTGQPSSQSGGLKDVTGTTTEQYIKSVSDAFNKMQPSTDGAVSPEPPDPETANVVDPTTNFTPNGLYQAALEYVFTGKMPSLGLGSGNQVRNQRTSIINKAGAIASSLGSSLPQIQAMYSANKSAATKFVSQALFVKTYLATATDNLDLALDQSKEVARTGAKFVNHYVLWAKGEFTPAGPLATFETYIYTAAREYAKVTDGGAMSAQGLTDSARKEAETLLNSAQSPEAFKATVDAMKADMANVVKELDKTVSGVTASLGIQAPTTSTSETDPLGLGV